jgi:hypothetical protein
MVLWKQKYENAGKRWYFREVITICATQKYTYVMIRKCLDFIEWTNLQHIRKNA